MEKGDEGKGEKGKRGNVKRETKGYSCKIVWDYWGNQIYDMTR